MELCGYGCGREAKYPPRKGMTKWCCKKDYRMCLSVRKKNSKSSKGKSNYWKGKKRNPPSNETKNKLSVIRKYTIDQIQEKYKTFTKEEEMRYNPDKPGEKEIQVHCKYNKCKNSKENGGWFTPTKEQIWRRRDALDHVDGSDGCYFYCPEGCEQKCCLFNLRSDPDRLTEYEKYNDKVWKETNKVIKEFSNKIKNIELRGRIHGYALDHKYSIYDGFNNSVGPKIIGHYKNLQIITIEENSKKYRNSSITLEKLLVEIENI